MSLNASSSPLTRATPTSCSPTWKAFASPSAISSDFPTETNSAIRTLLRLRTRSAYGRRPRGDLYPAFPRVLVGSAHGEVGGAHHDVEGGEGEDPLAERDRQDRRQERPGDPRELEHHL